MYEQTSMSVQCNIILNNGYVCGLPPIGRCATCQRAFCSSHQVYDRTYFGDLIPRGICVMCAAEQQEKERKRQEEAYALYEYFGSGAARTALLRSRVQPVVVFAAGRRWEPEKGLFGQTKSTGRYVDGVFPIGHGCILGEFKWGQGEKVRTNDAKLGILGAIGQAMAQGKDIQVEKVFANFLTALVLDLFPESITNFLNHSGLQNRLRQDALVAVQPYSQGYKVLLTENDFQDWREAMQAVKRLAGESS